MADGFDIEYAPSHVVNVSSLYVFELRWRRPSLVPNGCSKVIDRGFTASGNVVDPAGSSWTLRGCESGFHCIIDEGVVSRLFTVAVDRESLVLQCFLNELAHDAAIWIAR